MSDGTILSLGVGGDTLYNKDNGADKTAVTLLAVGSASPFHSLASATNPVPAQLSVGNAAATTANPVPVVEAPIAGAAYAPSLSTNLATGTANVKTGTGNLRSVMAVNRNAAIRYLQIFDAVTATGTPIMQFPLDGVTAPTSSVRALGLDFFGPQGVAFATGLTFGVSTTSGSYVAATAADHDVILTYK